jgi:CubicO group peptidase (beta-lactamase class C family)
MKRLFFLIALLSIISCNNEDNAVVEPIEENIYFPTTTTWETKTPESLGWNTNNLQTLYNFLEQKNSKSFIILHNGKIVVEKYFNNHTATSQWYWASAGKTLTTTISGIAAQEGLLNLNDKVSDYLGTGWTSAPIAKENLIKCHHLLSMTSGLNDALGDDVSPTNLQYVADAGNRWAYHNVYVKMQDVVANASNTTWNNYFNTKLKNKIGMEGNWFNTNDLSVYFSNTKSMARFGLLVFAKGKWQNEQIINQAFLETATNPTQSLNNAYGYLWWLNGKANYRLPQSQIQFNGSLIPSAPADMYCALGKDDQKIYIVPSKKLVIIRMGNSAEGTNFALSNFDNELWQKINTVIN